MKISDIIEKNRKSIVLLDITIPKENNQFMRSIRGTGFMVSCDGKFITCSHVYKEIKKEEIPYLSAMVPGNIDEKGVTHYSRHKVELLKMDEENDLALMQIIADKGIEFEFITKIGNSEDVKEGEEAIFIGYPLALEMIMMGFGITMSTSRCIISSVKRRGADGSLHYFFVDTHINSGSSGSPLFSEAGGIIGIVSGRIDNNVVLADGKTIKIPASMGICRPAKYIKEIIK